MKVIFITFILLFCGYEIASAQSDCDIYMARRTNAEAYYEQVKEGYKYFMDHVLILRKNAISEIEKLLSIIIENLSKIKSLQSNGRFLINLQVSKKRKNHKPCKFVNFAAECPAVVALIAQDNNDVEFQQSLSRIMLMISEIQANGFDATQATAKVDEIRSLLKDLLYELYKKQGEVYMMFNNALVAYSNIVLDEENPCDYE